MTNYQKHGNPYPNNRSSYVRSIYEQSNPTKVRFVLNIFLSDNIPNKSENATHIF